MCHGFAHVLPWQLVLHLLHWRFASGCLWWDTGLANQQKFWINPWQLGLVSPDSDRNSMKFLSEDGFCEIQDEVSRFHCCSAVGDPRLLFAAEQILFGWSWMISTCTSRANDFLALFQSCSNRATFQASQEVLCPLDPNVTDKRGFWNLTVAPTPRNSLHFVSQR